MLFKVVNCIINEIQDGKDEKKKVSWVKSSGKHKNEKKKAENRGAIPLKKKGGRRSTAADDLSLSSMWLA